MVLSLYGKSLQAAGGGWRLALASKGAVYAQVVVDLPARELGDRVFTYQVPEYLILNTFIGAHVLVPFGHQEMVGGFVIAITDQISGDFHPKEILEVLDNDPLFDPNYIDFLYFIADYYLSSLSSVMQAAVPSGFSPRVMRVVELSSSDWLDGLTTTNFEAQDNGVKAILGALRLTARSMLSMRTLKQRTKLRPTQFYRSLSLLRQNGIVTIRSQSSLKLSPKLVSTVVWTGKSGTTPRQDAIVGTLRHNFGQMLLNQLIETAGTTYATIKKMSNQGIVCLTQKEVLRDPMDHIVSLPEGAPSSLPSLTPYQERALDVLSQELKGILSNDGDREVHSPWLLFGITGSGKTEVYLRLIQQALNEGRTALLLVPEISLTPQLAQRLKSRFGHQVAVWHSALSPGERYDTWRRLKEGDVKVLLGARSAILASMPRLGLIIIDEEHDGSYKQSTPNPRYNAKTLALEKARRQGAMVVLGSATPDVCSYYEATQIGQILELPERVFQKVMPEIYLVDMRQELSQGNRSIFSLKLLQALTDCLARKEQAILLINRRGFASHVFCRACGYVVKCRNCSVSMVFHQPAKTEGQMASAGHLRCHHCGHFSLATSICPACQSPFLKQYGLGTQRVEQEILSRLKGARTLRLDSDVASRRGAFEEIFNKFSAHEADILIGTQMVAKGLDIHRVTLVGVLAADAAFNLPDYRSLERGFQLLTQVSGRAGRGDRPGRVILQSYNTEMPALMWARQHDYKHFVEQELLVRKELGYPPFSQIIRVVVTGLDQMAVEAACEQLTEELTHFLEDSISNSAISILGPAPCLIERIQGKFRHHILIKNFASKEGRELLSSFLRTRRMTHGLSLAIDVDAFDLI